MIKLGLSLDDEEDVEVEQLPPLEEDNKDAIEEESKMEEVD